jgi:hypothetical protein
MKGDESPFFFAHGSRGKNNFKLIKMKLGCKLFYAVLCINKNK